MSLNWRVVQIVIAGGGAAGFFAAIACARANRDSEVSIFERSSQFLSKVRISGGGRCNFTNLHTGPEHFLSANPHFAKSALALYQPRHFIELVDRYGIAWHEKTLGQLFCDGLSRAILNMLLAECKLGSVEVVLNAQGIQVERTAGNGFKVVCSSGVFTAEALVVATGGLSIPKMGATGLGYDLARQFGLEVVKPRPGLVPLVLGGDEARWTELAGIAAEVVASAGGSRFREKMLVTHRGLSGPAVLQASSYWRSGEDLVLDLAPGRKVLTALIEVPLKPGVRRDLASMKQALRTVMPQRLANYLAEAGGPKGWSNRALDACEEELHRWAVHPVGTEGFEKAEVTAGGVDTDELSAKTMETRKLPGLFFIGEVVDVTGQLGGFNFQWAWASGAAAGRAV